MSHLGDYDVATILYGKFTTLRPSTQAPYTLAGSPALSVYKDNSTTQSTAGVTLTVDFDGLTGLHHFTINTGADSNFYSAGSFFTVVITSGTVDSVSVVGQVVASFTIQKSYSSATVLTAITDLNNSVNELTDNTVQLGETAQTAFQNFFAANTAAKSVDDVFSAIGTGGDSPGSGADLVTLTIKKDGIGLPDAQVWVSSDSTGNTVVAGTKLTNSEGKVSFLLDAGSTYYLWMQKDGVNPILGQSFVAIADT